MTNGTGEMTIAAVGMTGYGTGRRGQGTLDGMTVSIPDPALAAGTATGAGPGPMDGAGPQGAVRLRVGHSVYDGVDVAAIVAALRTGAAMPTMQQGQQTQEVTDLDVVRGEGVLLHIRRLASVGDTLASGAVHGLLDATDMRFGDTEPSLHRFGYERFSATCTWTGRSTGRPASWRSGCCASRGRAWGRPRSLAGSAMSRWSARPWRRRTLPRCSGSRCAGSTSCWSTAG